MEKRTKKIDNREYVMLLPSAREGMKLSAKVALTVGPIMATLGLQLKKDEGAIEKLTEVLASVDPAKLDAMFMKAVNITTLHCNTQPIYNETDFERHFGTYRGEIFQVCAWVLTEAVSDFFPWLADLGQITDKMKAEFLSQTDGPPNTGSEGHSGKDSAPTES